MAIQQRSEFASALNQVCSERGIEPEIVLDSIKQAILAAYRKDYGEPEGIDVDLDASSGEVILKKDKKIVTPPGFGRIAAQTAKQVILQRIREAEKNAIMSEYSSKVGTIVSGIIQRISGPIITVNLGKAEGIVPPPEQARNEKYYVNQHLKFYVVGIKEGARGEEIILSRSANGLLEGLFKQEVPEMASGAVEVKAMAREAGSRSKIAVYSGQLGVDPVGSCVGQKGVRVQAVINELGDEKIDVIAYQEDPAEFIKAALSPAKDLQVKIDDEGKVAEVTAPDDQLSLAIGKEGQNVRLAAKLTGFKIDIRGKSGTPKEVEAKEKAAQEQAKKALGIADEEKPAKEKPKEKGTAEKSSAVSEPNVFLDDQPSQEVGVVEEVSTREDQEPLISAPEEAKEEKEAQKVAKKIKAPQSKQSQAAAYTAQSENAVSKPVPADLEPAEPEDAKVLQDIQEENDKKPDSGDES